MLAPARRTVIVLVGMVIAGFVALVLGWRGVAATHAVWFQVPFLVSGALGAVALIGTAIGLLSIHLDRVSAAEEQEDLDAMIRAVERVVG